MKNPLIWLALAALASGNPAAPPAAKVPLPLPAPEIPENPPFPPMVITAGGQRLLLDDSDVAVAWDPAAKRLKVNRPGWWVVNFPLTRIGGLEGKSADEIARTVFGIPSAELRNWYMKEPGTAAAEPAMPTGPARFIPHESPGLIVDGQDPRASDENAGTAEAPLRSIGAAVAMARPGTVIQVKPGIYRESVTPKQAGEKDRPIVLEGLRGEDGAMPVITANDAAPADAWQPVRGHPGLWRAEAWTPGPAKLALDGKRLAEGTLASELKDHQFAINRGDRELALPRVAPSLAKAETLLDRPWQVRAADAKGHLDLGPERGVYALSSWLWMPPGQKGKEVWDPRFPQPLTGDVRIPGGFRAGRTSAVPFSGQLNPYRLWLNGEPMPAAGEAGQARANTDYGRDGDSWQRLSFKQGWNHVFLLVDSSVRSDFKNGLRFELPKGKEPTVSTANEPADATMAIDGEKAPWIREWRVAGPLPKQEEKPERAVYLKLPAGADPNRMAIDMGARAEALVLHQPYWQVRGFELRHGAQYQQRALVSVGAAGVVLEKNLIKEPEVRGLSLVLSNYAFAEESAVVRGNWIVSPGALGIGASGDSGKLTPENQNSPPARGRVLIEHNVILDNNRSGYARFWESGAMKFFRMTGCVIRHNTVVEGDGPAIWLDWEHYGNRIEGNLALRPMAFAVGIEASPGPNLIANNVAVGTRPGGAWFEYAFLAWSSARTWAVSNTIDGPNGMMFAEGNDNRNTRWGALAERPAAVVNNLVIGRPTSLHRGRLGWVEGNLLFGPRDSGLRAYSKWSDADLGKRVEASPQMAGADALPGFMNPDRRDFRTRSDDRMKHAGVSPLPVTASGREINLPSLVKHDFHGLLRFADDGTPAGAYRNEPPAAGSVQVEIERHDGTMSRWTGSPPRP